MMQSKVLIAAAGSGKTSLIVEEALSIAKKILILTYTIENTEEIRNRLINQKGYVPSNITVQSWFSFLLKEAIRPYQNLMYDGERVSNLNFEPIPDNLKYVRETDTKNYYFTRSGNIYRDRISDFAFKSNVKSQGLTIKRLEKMYDKIYIDEIQDMAGWDLDFLELLINSNIELTFVGDIRQATYTTNNSNKNKQYKGADIIKWFEQKQKKGKCTIEYKVLSYRCNQPICDFADALYPHLEKTTSQNSINTGHDGLFYVKPEKVLQYVNQYSPQILRNDKNVETANYDAINFGQSKGQTYDRVLIYPTKTIAKYLSDGILSKVKNGKSVPAFDIPKLYVALTRARYSVAIVLEAQPHFDCLVEYN